MTILQPGDRALGNETSAGLTRSISQASAQVLNQPFVIVGAITLLAAAVRLYHLGYKPFWYDEAVMYWISQGSLTEVLAQNAAKNSAPPAFALLLHLVSRVGASETLLRAVPWLAGVAAIPTIYALARQFVSRKAAYFCALMVALSATQVHYSQELREYSITFVLVSFIWIFFCRYLRSPTWFRVLVLTLLEIIGIFVQYGIVLQIFTLSLVILIKLIIGREQRRLLATWLPSQLLILVAAALVYQIAFRFQMMPSGFAAVGHLAAGYWQGTVESLRQLALKNTLDIINFAYPAQYSLANPLPWLFPLFLGLGVWTAFRRRQGWLALLLFALPWLCVFLAACARLYPYLGARQDMFLTPMTYVLVAIGFDHLFNAGKARLLAPVLALALLASGLAPTYGWLLSPGAENIRPLVKTLSAKIQPGDRVYVYYSAAPALSYYFHGGQQSWFVGKNSRTSVENYFREVDGVLSQPGRVWLAFSHCWANECQLIAEHASKSRHLQLVNSEIGSNLYLAD